MVIKVTELLQSADPIAIEKGLRLAEGSNSPILLSPLLRLARSAQIPSSNAARQLALKKAKGFLKGAFGEASPLTIEACKKIIETFDPSYILHLNYQIEAGTTDEIVSALILLKHFVSESRAEDILKICIRNPEKKVRATAVKHIGEIASKANAEVLARFLEDSDNRVKANAIEVFETLNNKYFTRILNRFRGDGNNRIRANALKTLQILGDFSVSSDLEKMLNSQDSLMRTSAVWAIGELGVKHPGLLSLLEIVKDDTAEPVQNNLLIVLKKVGNAPEAANLKKSLQALLKNKLSKTVITRNELVVENSQNEFYTTFKLTGSLTAQTILSFKSLIEDFLKNEKVFVMNFSKLTYLDSSGVGFLINFQKKLKNIEGSLFIHSCGFKLLEMLQVSKMDMIINVFNTAKEVDEFLGIKA